MNNIYSNYIEIRFKHISMTCIYLVMLVFLIFIEDISHLFYVSGVSYSKRNNIFCYSNEILRFVDQLSVNGMSVDKLSVNEMSKNELSLYKPS